MSDAQHLGKTGALSMRERGVPVKVVLALVGAGALIHLLFVRWEVYLAYKPPADRSFVDNLYVNLAVGLLGGLFYALFLRGPVIEWMSARRDSLSTLVKGAFWGFLATIATFQTLYILGGCFLMLKMKAGVPKSSLTTDFLLSIMDIETYGLFVMFYYLVPSFIAGALATTAVGRLFQASGSSSGGAPLPSAPQGE